MSRLEELIRQLCPDGVEYKLLSELFNTKTDIPRLKAILNFGLMELYLGFEWKTSEKMVGFFLKQRNTFPRTP